MNIVIYLLTIFIYNSLVLSNAMNTKIQLVDTDKYDSLDNEQKHIIFSFDKTTYGISPKKFILCKEGVYIIFDKEGKVKDVYMLIPWNEYEYDDLTRTTIITNFEDC